MKKLSIIMIVLLIGSTAFAQSKQPCSTCLPEGITFETQAQIDSFQINYPNCTEIEGNVSIGGSDITNLDGLNVVTSVGANLVIGSVLSGGNPVLTDLEGLSALNFIAGDLYLGGNYALNDLNGLQGISVINGNLTLALNAILNLTGLDSVIFINGNLTILENNNLTTLNGLNSLETIDGSIFISSNDSLANINGFESMTIIGGSLEFDRNNSLINFGGLDNLISIGGDLQIGINAVPIGYWGNDNLEDIGSLSALTYIGGNLHIKGNGSLSACDIQSICDYLAAPIGTIEIEYNATGCNSQEEVEEACGVGIDETITSSNHVNIYPNPSSTQIIVELPTTGTPLRNITLTIFNINGQQIIKRQITEPQIVVDVSGLVSGVYFIKMVSDNGVQVGKMVKE